MERGRIIVALSGGVDSSVAAALLVDEGYAVEGVYLKYASELVQEYVDTSSCTWEDDLRFVTSVGERLGIRVRSINVEREYNEAIVAPFFAEHARGRTPNPDILCNREIKFGLFLRWALRNGATAIATGHYARRQITRGRSQLLAGADAAKDQSYFLYAIPRSALERVLFPLGHLTKVEVRALARRFGLPTADREESQGLCFVGHLRVREFLAARLGLSPGRVLTSDGKFLGTHPGLPFFTIGQRHGLGLGGGTPLYVAAKDPETNSLTVARGDDDPLLFSEAAVARDPAWLEPPPAGRSFRCQARLRYRQPLIDVSVHLLNHTDLLIQCDRPQRAVTPGQAIVFYHGDLVLGGATVERAIHQISEVHHPITTP